VTTWKVKKDGTGDHTTIGAALAAAAANDTVEVYAGTYSEKNLARAVALTVVVPVAERGLVLVDAGAAGNVFKPHDGWTLQGFRLTNSGAFAAVTGDGGKRTFNALDLEVFNFGTTAAHHGIAGFGDGALVDRCVVYNGTGKGIAGEAISSPASTIRACVVYDVGDIGIHAPVDLVEGCTVVDTGGAIAVHAGTVRNTIAEADDGAAGIGILAVTAHDNNTAHGYSVDPFQGAAEDAESDTVDPVFEDLAGRDLRLSAASPVSVTGQGSTSAAVYLDADGVVYRSAPSRGAFQWVPVPTEPVIESFLYAASTAGSQIEVSEDGVVFYTLQLPESVTVRDALTAWTILANEHASLTGVYSFVWDPSAGSYGACVMKRTDGTFAFRPTRKTGRFLGFSSSSYALAASHTSDTNAEGISTVVGIGTPEVPRAEGERRVREFRHGRVLSISLAYAYRFDVVVVLDPTLAALFEGGPLFHGRIRLSPPGVEGRSAYALTNLCGFVDGEVFDDDKEVEGFVVLVTLALQWEP